jgi:integrase/recombinase XerD
MLTLYRRHLKACGQTSRTYRRCKRPIWVQGTLSGETVRRSLDLTSWEAATDLVHCWSASGKIGAEGVMEVETAVRKFLADAEARHLREGTLKLLRALLEKQLLAFCRDRGFRFLRNLNVDTVREFRNTWQDAPITAYKKFERFRTFLRFCEHSGWLPENPAAKVKLPRVTQSPTLPFTDEELAKILAACDKLSTRGQESGENPPRAKAFVLLLRYSGLRLNDAVTLRRDRITDGRLFLYTQKTGTPVFLPLPKMVLDALRALNSTDTFFFWSGNGNPKSAMSSWDRTLRTLFRLAGIDGGHAHRFRDTFAVSLLQGDVPLESVSILLGHSSVRVTLGSLQADTPGRGGQANLGGDAEEKQTTPWSCRKSRRSVQQLNRSFPDVRLDNFRMRSAVELTLKFLIS